MPLLPPLFYPPTAPEQPAVLATDTIYHKVAPPSIPSYPQDVLQRVKAPEHPPSHASVYPHEVLRRIKTPPKPLITVYPQSTTLPPPAPFKIPYSNSLNEIPEQPLHLLITPILKAALRRKKEIISKDIPSFFGFGAPPKPPPVVEGTNAKLVFNPGFSIPAKPNDVMFYLPSPDLSSGGERSRALEREYVPRVTKLVPEDYFVNNRVRETSNEIDYNDSVNYVEKEEDLKDEQDVGQTTAINLSPDDTIIVDLSQTSNNYYKTADEANNYYETADEAYNEVVETEDDLEAATAITDSIDFESEKVVDKVMKQNVI